MQNKWIQQPRYIISLLSLMLVSSTVAYADGFYTIIGPDGRPMIVPKNTSTPQSNSVNRNKANIKQIKAEPTKDLLTNIQVVQSQRNSDFNASSKEISKKSVESFRNIQPSTTSSQKIEDVRKMDVNITQQSKLAVEETLPKIQSSSHPITETQINAFDQVDGVEYVNSEYLEDQEFNLEGKKRFYTMPDGTGRFETIERKKGVSRSILDKFMNRSQQGNTPIVLAASYVRLSAQDLSSAFEDDRCFLKDYTKAIKTLTPQKEIGLWPRKPLKEKFEYELVQLDTSIQYIQVDSYTSSNVKPVYYWPLVLFLDEKGCIQEGVSGFKNSSVSATLLQHASIQGVLKVPSQARYIMLTPLASAVDISEQELSNKGQIKLSVLQ